MNSDPAQQDNERRPYLGVRFTCCNVYTHIFLNAQQSAFVGWCPRCAAKLEIKAGPDGSDERIFEAG